MSDQDQQQQDTRSPEEIESDINDTRSHLDETLSDFQSRFSSDSMMHNAMDYVKSDSCKEYFSNLGRSVRDNPMPAALIGLGIGWMMYSNNSSNDSNGSRNRIRNHFDDKRQAKARRDAANTSPQTHEYDELYDNDLYDEEHIYGAGLTVEGDGYEENFTGNASDNDSQGKDGLRQRAGNAMGGVGSKARNMKSGAGDRMSRMKKGSGQRLQGASSRARDTGNWLNELAHDNPVAAGALGLAAGALLGSLLPSSRAEQRAMGDTRDQLVNKATEMGSEQLNRASDKAQEEGKKHTSEGKSDNGDESGNQKSSDSQNKSGQTSTAPLTTGSTTPTTGSTTTAGSTTPGTPGSSTNRTDNTRPGS